MSGDTRLKGGTTATNVQKQADYEIGCPVQLFYQNTDRHKTPEEHLIAAVIIDAARIIKTGPGRGHHRGTDGVDVYAETLDWVKGKYLSLPGYSFCDICSTLELDFNNVQEHILKQAPLAERIKWQTE